MQWVTIHRVCGELSVSRSLGDPDFKGVSVGEVSDAYFDFPEDHSRLFMADLVIPDPEFKHADLTEEVGAYYTLVVLVVFIRVEKEGSIIMV